MVSSRAFKRFAAFAMAMVLLAYGFGRIVGYSSGYEAATPADIAEK